MEFEDTAAEDFDGPAYLRRARDIVAAFGRPVSIEELEKAGVYRMALTKLVAADAIERPAKGVYYVPASGDDMRVLWAAISLAYDCTFCLMSAAAYHDLTEEAVGRPHVAINKAGRVPMRSSVSQRVAYYGWPPADLHEAVDTVEIQGVPVRVTSPARTVVDLFRYSEFHRERGIEPSVLGTSFIDALTRFMDHPDSNERTAELRRIAEGFGVWERVFQFASVVTQTSPSHSSRHSPSP